MTMYPKRNFGPVPGTPKIKPVTAKSKPRSIIVDSGTYYDFYLERMSPRLKTSSRNRARGTSFVL